MVILCDLFSDISNIDGQKTPKFPFIKHDDSPPKILFILDDKCRIEKNDHTVRYIGRGNFIGEMSYLTNKPDFASVISDTNLRYYAFDRNQLRQYLAENSDIGRAIEASFNHDLINKLANSNARNVT